jgi:predicted Zn-dependent protease
MPGRLGVLIVVILCGACATFPEGAYYPSARDPHATALARSLHRAAMAADDDPKRYTFAMIHTRDIAAYTMDDASFYFTDGLARLPAPSLDALVAQQVAHEVLGHVGRRRALSLSMTAGFTVFGVMVPGVGLIDYLVGPLVVRAYTRDQVLAADAKAVEILSAMGYAAPRRVMANAIRMATAHRPVPGGLLATEPSAMDRLAALEPLESTPRKTAGQPR